MEPTSTLTLIQKLEIENSYEYKMLAVNERPPLQVLVWILQRISRKCNVDFALVHNYVNIELYTKESLSQ